ncbi:MAG TPA: DUF2283 domain-containing protein [Candidatus Nanoarchaeia archaeon]|nr:DUF2283 domain-containing protein [Candidatus Nanoarchaeia archaeon]
MEIEYDKETDALYIELKKGTFAKNKVINKDTIIDLDKNGNVLGIELLFVSKRMSLKSLSEISLKNMPKITA